MCTVPGGGAGWAQAPPEAAAYWVADDPIVRELQVQADRPQVRASSTSLGEQARATQFGARPRAAWLADTASGEAIGRDIRERGMHDFDAQNGTHAFHVY